MCFSSLQALFLIILYTVIVNMKNMIAYTEFVSRQGIKSMELHILIVAF